MSISDTDREWFINFMMQKDYIPPNNQVRDDVVIYILKTDWLKPFHTTFYVGYTTDMNQRINGDGYHKGHKDSYQKEWRDITPEYCYQRLQSIAIEKYESQEYGSLCKEAREGIITACKHQGDRVQCPIVDTILQKECKEYFNGQKDFHELTHIERKALGITTFDVIDIELGSIKTRFTNEVLEREMRWIFKTFQEGANLTNMQRIYRHMIRALRYRPHIDVLHTPFSSLAWDPIIESYLEDQRLLGVRS